MGPKSKAMINDIIKNRYIVCQSPGHGKRIIDFFVKNGAVNPYGITGVQGCYYWVDAIGHMRWSSAKPISDLCDYTEIQLPEEFTPKRGDVVEVSDLKKFEYYFVIGENSEIAEVKYHQYDDGLSTTVRFPQMGELIIVKGKHYFCKMVTHNYDDNVIGFHLIETKIDTASKQ